jgi:spermidine synthase
MSMSYRIFFFALVVFLSSALLMTLELVAARIVAPYVGVSLYTWTSIIGVILAGLSLGNWLGGVWADRGAGERAIGWTLGLASLTCIGILLLLTIVAPTLQALELSLLGASFLYVISLFFVPAILLGIITPLLTTLLLKNQQRPGHIVGMMNALAALGSIVGTFVTGYWWIQYVGTRMIVTSTSIILFAMALPFFLKSRAYRELSFVTIAVAAVVSIAFIRDGFANPCTKESQYFCIRVVNADSDVPVGQAKALVLDHLIHGINHRSIPEMLVSPYVQAMDELVAQHFDGRTTSLKYFFAGGGSYTHPRAVRAMDVNAEVTVAEVDPWVTHLVRSEMFVDTYGMRIMHMDARLALQKLTQEKFDVIVGDVFHDVTVPFHLTTSEYVNLVHNRLTDDGIYVLNVVDVYPDSTLVKSIYKTLRLTFKHVHLWLEAVPNQPQRMTYVFSASDTTEPTSKLVARRGFKRTWRRATDDVLSSGINMRHLPILTDDYVPVDRLTFRLIATDLGL